MPLKCCMLAVLMNKQIEMRLPSNQGKEQTQQQQEQSRHNKRARQSQREETGGATKPGKETNRLD